MVSLLLLLVVVVLASPIMLLLPAPEGSEDAMMGVVVTVKIASKRSLNEALIAPRGGERWMR